MTYLRNKEEVVQYVDALLTSLRPASQSIMTITAGRSVGYSVSTVTDGSSDDTDLQTAKFYSDTQVNT